jgi:hypothetical protein
MLRMVSMIMLGMLLAGCGVSPATRPPEATLPPATATSAPPETVTVLADGLQIIVPGYQASCIGDPTLSIPAGHGWKPLEDFIMEHHYLDGAFKFVAAMCDVVVCTKVSLEAPIYLGFPLYEHLGERKYLKTSEAGTFNLMVPDYRTVRPSGMVKLDVLYFLDDTCSQPQSYTTILDLPN